MNQEQKEILEVIEGSIDKWVRIAAGSECDKGAVNCPLCIYNTKMTQAEAEGDPLKVCTSCLVFKKTGQIQCADTPYRKFREHVKDRHLPYLTLTARHGDNRYRTYCKECVKLAMDELDFLNKLRDDFLESITPVKKYFLKIGNSKTALGEGFIWIKVVDQDGNGVEHSRLLNITPDGKICGCTNINPDLPLSLDDAGSIKEA